MACSGLHCTLPRNPEKAIGEITRDRLSYLDSNALTMRPFSGSRSSVTGQAAGQPVVSIKTVRLRLMQGPSCGTHLLRAL